MHRGEAAFAGSVRKREDRLRLVLAGEGAKVVAAPQVDRHQLAIGTCRARHYQSEVGLARLHAPCRGIAARRRKRGCTVGESLAADS